MFFFIAVTSSTKSLGQRLCRYFPCCGANRILSNVTCVSKRFVFFFIPLFRFGKRYFISCPRCGAVYEISKMEGNRLERNPYAEIDPNHIYRMVGQTARYCPYCGARLEPGSSYCPKCGRML
ncbi:MAG TPA: hypothetical protein DG942_04660 [Ruminococcaceae bacterium]|jgi:uncharacterized OB-fold protein|nr:hypothetical protein [Oscillospiraceae bacterium]